jgi:O-antigen ligase
MLETRSKQVLGTLTLVAVAAVTLVVAPYTLMDPMGLPKLVVLAFLAIVALSLMAPTLKSVFNSNYKTLTILTVLFVFQIVLVMLFSGANITAQFLGTYQRHTGALTYISLAILMLSTALVSDGDFLKRFTRITLVVGAILIVYGNLQYLGLEPFPYVNAYTANAPIGTFGNPNFQSAFMGMIAVTSFTLVLKNAQKKSFKFGFILIGVSSLIVVYETLSKQGFLNFIAGSGAVIIIWLFMTKRKSLALAASGLGAVGTVFTFLGLINTGPLASILYKGSLEARGMYWRAGVKMLIEHPFFGVGMDRFGDFFHRSRPADYVAKGFFSYSNAAHNVYLDIASNGGFALLGIYLAILAITVNSIIRYVKRSEGFDVYFVAIIGAWVAYQSQAFISINQIGLAIWGWVLSGLIIGYEINTRAKEVDQSVPVKAKQQFKKVKSQVQPLSSGVVISLFVGVLVGAIVAGPIYFSNSRFYAAIKANDLKGVESAAYLKPQDERRLFMLAGIYRNAKMDDKAVEVLKEATVTYPDSYDMWALWLTIPTATPSDIAYVKTQIHRLDPPYGMISKVLQGKG